MPVKIKDNSIILENEHDQYIGNIKYVIEKDIMTIINVYITPKFRKNNYSNYLFEELHNLCIKENITRVELIASEYYSHYGKLLKYYEKFSFNINQKISIKEMWKDGELIRLISMYKIIKH